MDHAKQVCCEDLHEEGEEQEEEPEWDAEVERKESGGEEMRVGMSGRRSLEEEDGEGHTTRL